MLEQQVDLAGWYLTDRLRVSRRGGGAEDRDEGRGSPSRRSGNQKQAANPLLRVRAVDQGGGLALGIFRGGLV